MIQRFDDLRTDETRAFQAYLILIGAAHNRQIITYKILSDLLGYKKGAGVLAGFLGHIMFWCEDEGLPPLTALVVNQDTGSPGAGLTATTAEGLNKKREEVFNYDWYALIPPTPEQLDQSFKANMQALKSRGL